MKNTTEEQVKILCIKMGISVAELARRCGKSPQTFSQKMKRKRLTPDDLKEIADVTGCTFETAFILPNGERITQEG